MANTILTPSMICRESLRLLHNNLAFSRNVNKQYDDRFQADGQKAGGSLDLRLPNKYTVGSGATLIVQDTLETKVTITRSTQRHVAMNFTSAELTLSIDDFSKRIVEPAMARLASEIDRLGCALYADVWNLVGSAGTVPSALATYLSAGEKLDNCATPRDANRNVVINPAAMGAASAVHAVMYNPGTMISDVYKRGLIGSALGFNWSMDQNITAYTCGTRTGTTLVNTTVTATTDPSTTSTIRVKGLTNATDTVTAGEIFTVAGVYAVNPETGATLGHLQQFVVTALATGSSNIADCIVYPPVITSGAYKTVNAVPTAEAAVTFFGTASTAYAQNLAFHRDAFVLATADLVMPKGVDFVAREVYDGISLRIVRQYDINNDAYPCRVDVLFGWKTVRPEMACRISA